MHLVNRLGYVIDSTQKISTSGDILIQGNRVRKILMYPAESDTVMYVIQKVLHSDHPEYVTYHVGSLQFMSIIIPAYMLAHIVEVHEIQITSWEQRLLAIRYLEGICTDRWHGEPGECKFRKVSNGG